VEGSTLHDLRLRVRPVAEQLRPVRCPITAAPLHFDCGEARDSQSSVQPRQRGRCTDETEQSTNTCAGRTRSRCHRRPERGRRHCDVSHEVRRCDAAKWCLHVRLDRSASGGGRSGARHLRSGRVLRGHVGFHDRGTSNAGCDWLPSRAERGRPRRPRRVGVVNL
jgi:hypothetical protein